MEKISKRKIQKLKKTISTIIDTAKYAYNREEQK